MGKILRHGYEQTGGVRANLLTNRARLAEEVGHVLNAIELLVDAGDLSKETIAHYADQKRSSISQWTHHQGGER